MDYNTSLPRMIIPEYGRNIQRMVEYCCQLESKEERNKCAKAIIIVMGQLNPHLRDIADYNHKLWDHLFIISDFRLDVDSPYPRPSSDILLTKPESVAYPKGRIKFKHYGKLIELIIERAKEIEESTEKEEIKVIIANQLKRAYLNWNKDSVTDEIILQHLSDLSAGKLKMDDSTKLSEINQLVTKRPPQQHKSKHHHGGGHKRSNSNSNNNNRNFKRNK